MAFIPSLLRATHFSNPFLSTLVPSISLAYGLQALVAIPSIAAQTERFYDLSGSLTYLSCTALSLYLPTIRARHAATLAGTPPPAWPNLLHALVGRSGGLNWRQAVLSTAVSIWATRRTDSRFTQIRTSPPKFLLAFFAQATWVTLCLLPVLSLNALPLTALPRTILLTDLLGLLLFTSGLTFEILADRQKSTWLSAKHAKKHDEDFLTTGLWSKSRHPNYFGEATLWSGIALVAGGVLTRSAAQAGMGLAGMGLGGKVLAGAMAGVSPAFVLFLLLKVSGVPMSEEKYDKRYGDRKDYQAWKENTPVFVPKF
ncbi:MAG: hypothetical protein HETSPECPRED_002708 [Heterodermia speciosa]|uniref:Steroid 5-alpha reductase C-terminal domain-containing protein n=1 Tax=Heterodermia speciosa TaxID=116794 RepID=A0A8H3F5F7_9LECA|nr:MAG: hypothetical protein HETSPECPRED_002708 [Heterodermia speciosa]